MNTGVKSRILTVAQRRIAHHRLVRLHHLPFTESPLRHPRAWLAGLLQARFWNKSGQENDSQNNRTLHRRDGVVVSKVVDLT